MKHFLDLLDYESDELLQMLQLATRLRQELRDGGSQPVLKGRILAMVFQKPSLRTRMSFDVAMKQLGGDAIMLGPQEIGLGKRESIADIARVLSGYVDCIMARVFEHAHLDEMSRYASVPVINGLSDESHPCQAMADMLTIQEHYGQLSGLRLAYIGDGNNVAASLAKACRRLGLTFAIATPPGYGLPDDVVERVEGRSGDFSIEQTHNPAEAVHQADVIYTDTWVSMGQEAESAQRRAQFDGFQINRQLLASSGRPSIVMHCLPAHRGDEITDEVADGPQSVIFQQAENRLHAQKAILVSLLADGS